MTVLVQPVVDGELLEECWKVYQLSFDPLRHLALQRHVMYSDEFDAVMADARITKFLVRDQTGALVGLATMSDDLMSMPLVSPEYFAHHFPERYAARQIYYIGFLAVHPDHHGSGVFADLVGEMTRPVADKQGLAVLDVCNYNRDRMHLPRAINWLASTFAPQVTMATLDAQSYVGYDFAHGG